MHTHMHKPVGSIAGHSKERQQARPSFPPSLEMMTGIHKIQVQSLYLCSSAFFFFVTVFFVLGLTYLCCPPKPALTCLHLTNTPHIISYFDLFIERIIRKLMTFANVIGAKIFKQRNVGICVAAYFVGE